MKSISRRNSRRFSIPRLPAVRAHEIRSILTIAICWTIVDFVLFLIRQGTETGQSKYLRQGIPIFKEIIFREISVFLISLIIGYVMISVMRNYLRNYSLWVNLLVKTGILIIAGFIINFVLYFPYEWLIVGRAPHAVISRFAYHMSQTPWLLQKMPEWALLFVLTLLAVEINEKYSPGVFVDIMLGRYLQPREENRIVLFVDLRDSTPIAEKLGNKDYFKFIRDFIFCISSGVLKHNGRIYQYVGDEIVVWWPATAKNAAKCVASLIESRKELNKNVEIFRRRYDITPEYKAGVHVGTVMVGQMGIVKKDLVMSGDTINTAARIRSACTELNQKFLVSKEMKELINFEEWQFENMGKPDLKGKSHDVEIFALKI
jgi:adenylate cyclase